MLLHRVEIEQQSAFLTEPTSGVLMGHLAWAYRYLHGPEALELLLDAYRTADREGGDPPLICSAALPAGMAPRPQFEHLAPDERQTLVEQQFGSNGAALKLRLDQAVKTMRNWRWIDWQIFAEMRDGLSAKTLFGACVPVAFSAPERTHFVSGPVQRAEEEEGGWQRLSSRVRTQPSMNRLTGGVQRGLLYDSDEYVYRPRQRLEIWVRIAEDYSNDEWLERWRALFALLAAQGFGARKSVGMGTFALRTNLERADETALPGSSTPNAFLSLSSWTPRASDPDAFAYRLNTRHGRLGGLYGSGNDVWKYPTTELLPGAVGRLGPGETLRPVYGGLVERVHRNRPEIVNFGYAFPVGVRLAQ